MKCLGNPAAPVLLLMLFCFTMSSASSLEEDELLGLASPELMKACDSALARLTGNVDSAIYHEAERPEVKDYKYINVHGKTFLVLIIGCVGSGEIIFADSIAHTTVYFREGLIIPGKHVVIDDLLDLNIDGIPELRINLSAGAHGMYASFLSIYRDSVRFVRKEGGSYLFFAIRGGIRAVDINGDGIKEIIVGRTSKGGTEETPAIYKWNGTFYDLINKASEGE